MTASPLLGRRVRLSHGLDREGVVVAVTANSIEWASSTEFVLLVLFDDGVLYSVEARHCVVLVTPRKLPEPTSVPR